MAQCHHGCHAAEADHDLKELVCPRTGAKQDGHLQTDFGDLPGQPADANVRAAAQTAVGHVDSGERYLRRRPRALPVIWRSTRRGGTT